MLFSLNFTTELDAKGIIVLTQRLRFSEGRKTGKDRAGPMRAAKTRLIADILCRSGIPVSDNLEVELGMFSH